MQVEAETKQNKNENKKPQSTERRTQEGPPCRLRKKQSGCFILGASSQFPVPRRPAHTEEPVLDCP
jgi:hypothetical protein